MLILHHVFDIFFNFFKHTIHVHFVFVFDNSKFYFLVLWIFIALIDSYSWWLVSLYVLPDFEL